MPNSIHKKVKNRKCISIFISTVISIILILSISSYNIRYINIVIISLFVTIVLYNVIPLPVMVFELFILDGQCNYCSM